MVAAYRIICTTQEPVYAPTTHAHIVAVGTGSRPDHYDRRWSLADVLAAIDRGDSFYTEGEQTGLRARVVAVECPSCRRRIIRSAADAVRDNNLDSLRRCA